MFQQNHHNSGVKLQYHSSHQLRLIGPRNHISRTFAPARSVVSIPPHWEAPSNAVAGPFPDISSAASACQQFGEIRNKFTKMYSTYINFQCFSELHRLKYSKESKKNPSLVLQPKKKHAPTWTHQSLVVSILVASLNVDIRRAIHKLRQVEHVLLGNVGQAQIPMLIDLPCVFSF